MRVTEIAEVSRSRMKISTDEELTFVLYRGELRRLRIRQGEEIEEEALRAIREEILPKRAKLRAMNLLKNRDYTVKQLRDKLKEGGYPQEIIEEALDYVQGFRYTDDLRYAENFIRCHIQDRSRRRIDRDTLESAWAGFEAEGGSQDEQAMIQALLAKKGFDPEEALPKERQRMYGYLMRKGFAPEQVRRALRSEELYD